MYSIKFLTRFMPLLSAMSFNFYSPEGGGGSGADDKTDDKGGDDKGGKGDDKTDKTDDGKVSRSDYEKQVAETLKLRKEAADLKREKSESATAKLKADKQWEELALAKEKEAEEAKKEAASTRAAFISEKKFSSVKAAATALGLRPEAVGDLEMLDLDAIVAETTSTGKVNILGADTFATRLKATKPHWFAEKTKPTVNSGGQRILDSGDAVTLKDVSDAEKAAHKSGDFSEYKKIHAKYQTQRQQSR